MDFLKYSKPPYTFRNGIVYCSNKMPFFKYITNDKNPFEPFRKGVELPISEKEVDTFVNFLNTGDIKYTFVKYGTLNRVYSSDFLFFSGKILFFVLGKQELFYNFGLSNEKCNSIQLEALQYLRNKLYECSGRKMGYLQ